MQIIKYKPARYGLGTESSQNLQPLDFSPEITNRFYNLLGDLEKRPGMTQIGTQLTTALAANPSGINLTGVHEYVDTSGHTTLFASGYGNLYRYNTSANTTASAWDLIPLQYDAYYNNTADESNNRSKSTLYSVQMNDKLIFCNGAQRNFYIDNPQADPDGAAISAGYTKQLYSTITKGTTGSGSTATLLFDSDISNWKTQTNVAVNDLILTYINTYTVGGIVTSVGTSSLDISRIDSSATGLGLAASTFTSGLPYRLIDLVELNIIPTISPGGTIYDNVAVAGAATNALAISVTSFNFSQTDIKQGDYVYNTTRAAVGVVTTVSSNINVGNIENVFVGISGQAAGDSLVFLKDAMPIATYPHVHYGSLYLIDARDQTKIRVSGPNDPEDFTTFSKTLASSTLDYGSNQPKGDILLTMSTFQRYFVVGGQQNLYVVDGTIPIASVTADVIDLQPVGLFPQGVVSHKGFASIGNEMLYLARDGLRSFLAAFSSNNTTTSNKSEQIKSQLIADIETLINTPDALQLIHYPRRNWVIMKIGNNMYNYNYTPIYQPGTSIYQQANYATITELTGAIANMAAFFVRRNGDLVMGSNDGKVYIFDNGAVTDAGASIHTSYVSPWHTLQEGTTELTLIIKDGRYIKPVFETFGNVEYNISVVGNYDRQATDSVVVTAQGAVVVGQSQIGNVVIGNTAITNPKAALRWRGEQCQITIETSSQSGGDIINSYSIYGNVFGRR